VVVGLALAVVELEPLTTDLDDVAQPVGLVRVAVLALNCRALMTPL
jgi:hypothetical protein